MNLAEQIQAQIAFNKALFYGDELVLNDNIIIPYFSMSSDQYKHLLNIAM